MKAYDELIDFWPLGLLLKEYFYLNPRKNHLI